MSRSMHLSCMTCLESIDIGQTDVIYTGMPEVMENLNSFLVKHRTWSSKKYSKPEDYHELLFMPEPYNGNFEHLAWKYPYDDMREEW